MQFAFDLISDLHVETWQEPIDFSGRATAPIAVVAGDVSADRRTLIQTLANLGRSYQSVFYIDGNHEHAHGLDNLATSYRTLSRQIQNIKNVVYLQDNVVIIDGIAILGTNGWWGFDFDLDSDIENTVSWYQQQTNLALSAVRSIQNTSRQDANYIKSSVAKLQLHLDVKHIVMVTHTVPDPELIGHDPALTGTATFNCMGNRLMIKALEADTESKIHTWCFGHYHGSVDQIRSGVRFVNNCRGRRDTQWHNQIYQPRRIVIDV